MIAKTPEEKLALKKAKKEYSNAKHQYIQEKIQLDAELKRQKERRELNPPILTGLLEKEHPLADDFPVYWNYRYVVAKNGVFNVVISDIKGNIRQLRKDLEQKYNTKIGEIFSCDLVRRNLI